MKKQPQGFSFIELLSVLSVISLLITVAVPMYSDYVLRARIAEVLLFTLPVKQQIARYYASTGNFPADNAAAGIAPQDAWHGNVVKQIEVINGAIKVSVQLPNTPDSVLYLIPMSDQEHAPLRWKCGQTEQTTVKTVYLPSTCRS